MFWWDCSHFHFCNVNEVDLQMFGSALLYYATAKERRMSEEPKKLEFKAWKDLVARLRQARESLEAVMEKGR